MKEQKRKKKNLLGVRTRSNHYKSENKREYLTKNT